MAEHTRSTGGIWGEGSGRTETFTPGAEDEGRPDPMDGSGRADPGDHGLGRDTILTVLGPAGRQFAVTDAHRATLAATLKAADAAAEEVWNRAGRSPTIAVFAGAFIFALAEHDLGGRFTLLRAGFGQVAMLWGDTTWLCDHTLRPDTARLQVDL